MKLKTKNNIVGLAMSASVGILTGLLYFIGKCDGKREVFTDIVTQLEELDKESEKTEN